MYDWKPTWESAWFVLTAVATVVLQSIAGQAPPTDVKTWAIGVGAGAVRAALGAVLSLMTGAKSA